jgi:anaerobic ribonucleoside-triphosphate reductase
MTITSIRKRDGRIVPFDESKIAAAITKAFNATYKLGNEEIASQLASEVRSILEVEGAGTPDVEHIQDIVERVLMDNGYVQTAKAYILYRSERNRIREMKTRLMRTYEEITFADAKDSDVKRENANIDGDTAMGTMLKYGSEGAKQFYKMFVLKPEHARVHNEGDIHIHDLDFYTLTTTCTQIDIKKLFKGGFSTGHGHLREPNDIASYSALCCIAIQSNQNDQHGGQSIVNFDYGMADGVRKTFKRLYRQNLAKALMLWKDMEDPEDANPVHHGIHREGNRAVSPVAWNAPITRKRSCPALRSFSGMRKLSERPRSLRSTTPPRRRTGPPIRPWRPSYTT